LQGTPYAVIYSTSAGCELSVSTITGWFAATIDIAGLSSKTTYYFQVKARDAVLNVSDWSVAQTTVTHANPNEPSSLAQNRSDNGNNIPFNTWTTNLTPHLAFMLTDPDAAQQVKYQLQISTSNDFVTNTEYTSAYQAQGAKEYTGASMTSGENYYWRVKTIDSEGLESEWSLANSGNAAVKIDTEAPTNAAMAATAGFGEPSRRQSPKLRS
jgi:chitodextrinase